MEHKTYAQIFVEKAEAIPTDWEDRQGRMDEQALDALIAECEEDALDSFSPSRGNGSYDPSVVYLFKDLSVLTIDNPHQAAFRARVSIRRDDFEEACRLFKIP